MDAKQAFRFLERRAEKAGKNQNLGPAEVVCQRLTRGVVVSLKFKHKQEPAIIRYFRGSAVGLFRISGSEPVDKWVHDVVSTAVDLSWFPIRQAAQHIQDYVAGLVTEALYTKHIGLDAFSWNNSVEDVMLVNQDETYDEIMIAEDLAADDLNFL